MPSVKIRPSQPLPDLSVERSGPQPVCGIDEAGRGPWAGPVVAAAVILDPRAVPEGINDSKQLSAETRQRLSSELRMVAEVGLGLADVAEIDATGVGRATYLAMARALADLPRAPSHALIDGRIVPAGLPCTAVAMVGGDRLSASIAAASIVAKVARDEIMIALAQQFPGYEWQTNKGYGTAAHREALLRLGVTQHHRRSFKPIYNILRDDTDN